MRSSSRRRISGRRSLRTRPRPAAGLATATALPADAPALARTRPPATQPDRRQRPPRTARCLVPCARAEADSRRQPCRARASRRETGSSAWRSRRTAICSRLRALTSPSRHSASISASAVTARFALRTSSARSETWRSPPSSTRRPASHTSTGPSMRTVVTTVRLLVAQRDRYDDHFARRTQRRHGTTGWGRNVRPAWSILAHRVCTFHGRSTGALRYDRAAALNLPAVSIFRRGLPLPRPPPCAARSSARRRYSIHWMVRVLNLVTGRYRAVTGLPDCSSRHRRAQRKGTAVQPLRHPNFVRTRPAAPNPSGLPSPTGPPLPPLDTRDTDEEVTNETP